MKISKLPASFIDFIGEYNVPAHVEQLVLQNPKTGEREYITKSGELYEALKKSASKKEFELVGYTDYGPRGEKEEVEIESRIDQFTHLFNEVIADCNGMINRATSEKLKAHLEDFRSRIEGVSQDFAKIQNLLSL